MLVFSGNIMLTGRMFGGGWHPPVDRSLPMSLLGHLKVAERDCPATHNKASALVRPVDVAGPPF